MTNDFLGKGSVSIFQPEDFCPKCSQKGIYYLGSAQIPNKSSPINTEAEFYFRCKNCGNEWTKYV